MLHGNADTSAQYISYAGLPHHARLVTRRRSQQGLQPLRQHAPKAYWASVAARPCHDKLHTLSNSTDNLVRLHVEQQDTTHTRQAQGIARVTGGTDCTDEWVHPPPSGPCATATSSTGLTHTPC